MRGNLEGLNDEGEVVENYKVVKRLIGHQSGNIAYMISCFIFTSLFTDTVGVEWSPDGRVLASCSLDGTICFWNCDPSSSQTLIGKIERAHSGFIKGLAWDPAGKFLASQSDDGSCIIWNVESMLTSQSSSTAFNLDPSDAEMFKESVLEKIFVNMSKMTFFHRPGWSPDGSLLALANATNRQLPAVALVERSNWQGPGTFFVGHMGPVEAVRFNPRFFTGLTTTERKEMLCAVASQDGQVSIWSSSRTSPLLVLQELFEHSVMDLAWTPEGNVLVAVSYDGAAVAVRIDPKEFELLPLTDSEQIEHLKNAFGNRSAASGSDTAQGYVESVKVIECLRENEQFLSNHPPSKGTEMSAVDVVSTVGTVSTMGTMSTISAVTSRPTTVNLASVPVIPVEPAIVNGKKRITPQLVTTNNGFSTFSPSGSSQPQMSQLSTRIGSGSGGMRLRDEDFLIHRKLLERASGSLLNGVKKDQGSLIFEAEDSSPASLSVSLTNSTIFSISLEITNYDVSGRKSSALIQFIQNSQIIWKERVKGTIILATGTRKYSAFVIQSPPDAQAAHKYSLLVLTSSGRRYLPPIALDSLPVHLSMRDSMLCVITQNGTISIWNLKECKLTFSDASVGCVLTDYPIKLLDFNETTLTLSFSSGNNDNTGNLQYNESLGTWIVEGSNITNKRTLPSTSTSSVTNSSDRSERIEKLKQSLLSNESGNDRQISELEFELSLIFVSLRNGKALNPSEMAHFERTLAIYALKLAKEARSLKAKELIEDLKELGFEHLIEELMKPFLSSCQASSTWQDFITETL